MTDPNNLRQTLRDRLAAAADEKCREKAERLTSGAKCLGVTVPQIRTTAKELKKEWSEVDFETLCQVADLCFENECREEILCAIFLLALHKKRLNEIKWNRINRWTLHLDNWETCDQLSSNILTPILLNNTNPFMPLEQMALSANKWERRLSAATAANLNHGGRTYPTETFRICQQLLTDKEPMVNKAVDWALREICQKPPEEVTSLLKQNKNTALEKRLESYLAKRK